MDANFSSLNFRHSSLITHHLKYPIPVWHHHSLVITQYFSHCLWAPYLSLGAAFFFFFFSIPKLTEQSEKKEKKKKPRNLNRVKEEGKKKKKKKARTKNRTQEKKGEKMVKRCGCGSLHVCLIAKVSLSYKWWKQKTGNKVMVLPNGLFTIGLTIFELWVMETELWVMKIDDPNSLLLIIPIL